MARTVALHLGVGVVLWAGLAGGQPFLGQGELVGEVTPTSAIIRTRLTLREKPNAGVAEGGPPAKGMGKPAWTADLPEGLPGAPGQVRIHYGADARLDGARVTDWREVDEKTNFSTQFALTELKPATTYYYRAECAWLAVRGGSVPPALKGRIGSFRTAPPPEAAAAVTLCVITGQAMRSRDLPPEKAGGQRGFASYLSMAALRPDFLVSTGDSVYYDNDGLLAHDQATARHHWNRLYALPSVRELFAVASGYWEKDDHDYRWNDCWPQQPVPGKFGSTITDELGRRLFLEAVPMGAGTSRTHVWGKGLQIWLPEGRDFRDLAGDSRKIVNGEPERSLWGAKQRAWLKQTLKASPCRYKLLISPTPVIGPDRGNKKDNHANEDGFWAEGRQFLQWAAEARLEGFFIICGDRHWQYHSVDPQTKVQEFSCGPISDKHAGGSPGLEPEIHKYHKVQGGFLSVAVEPRGQAWRIAFRFHAADGKVAHEVVDP